MSGGAVARGVGFAVGASLLSAAFAFAGADSDLDGWPDTGDNCPEIFNPDQANVDGDPAGDLCDCAPANASTYPGAIETNDGLDNNCPGDADYGIVDEISGTIGFFDPTNKDVLSWPAQPGATLYGVGWTGFRPPTTFCVFNSSGTSSPTMGVAPGQIWYFIIRANAPRIGSAGRRSDGTPRFATPRCS
jgi:hypothetical protein